MATCSLVCSASSAAAGAELLLPHKVEADAASSTASTCGPTLTRSNSVETSLSEVVQEHIDQPEHPCMQLEGEVGASNGMTFAQKRFRIRMGEELDEELADAATTSQATGADSSFRKETNRAKASFAEHRFNIQMLDAEVAEPLERAVQHADVKGQQPVRPTTGSGSLAQKRFAIRMGRDLAEEVPEVAGNEAEVHQHRAPTAMAASSHRSQEPSTQEARGVPLAQKRFEIRLGSSACQSSPSSAAPADQPDDAAACVSVVAPSFAQVRWAVRSQGEEYQGQGSTPPADAPAAAVRPQQQPRVVRRGHFKGLARMQDFDM